MNLEEPPHDAAAPVQWSPWRWVGLVGVVTVHFLVTLLTTAVVLFDTEGVCREPATAGDLAQARGALLVVVALSCGPWLPALIAAFRLRRRRLLFTAAVLTVTLYPLWMLGAAVFATPADWTMDWCLF